MSLNTISIKRNKKMKSGILVVIGVLTLVMSCGDTNNDAINIRWADEVIAYSTQYDTTEWAAFQALGAPDTYPYYGDIITAWASEIEDNQREFLELGYTMDPGPVRSIAIFETLAPGAVDTVYVRNPTSNLWEVIYQGSAAPAGDTSRIFIVNFPVTSFNVSAIRIALNSPVVTDWNEIDAVGISSDTIPPSSDTTFWAPILTATPPVITKMIKSSKKK